MKINSLNPFIFHPEISFELFLIRNERFLNSLFKRELRKMRKLNLHYKSIELDARDENNINLILRN